MGENCYYCDGTGYRSSEKCSSCHGRVYKKCTSFNGPDTK